MSTEKPRVPSHHRDLVFVDVETTGLDPKKHEIIEIAAIRRTFDRKLVAATSMKIRPSRLQDADLGALLVNGYSPKGWEEAGSLLEALTRFSAIVELADQPGPILVGHNVGFDRSFIAAAYEAEHLPPPAADYHSIDTASLAWSLCAQGLIERVKLEVVCDFFGISNEGAHGAWRDVERTIAVYDRLVPMFGNPRGGR